MAEYLSMNHARSNRWLVLWTFVAVLGARWWLVAGHGSPIPFWDQWDAEAMLVYLPWAEGRFEGTVLWARHNEHRLILTHLLNLGLFVFNGRWDPIMQMALNAVWPSIAAAFVARLLIRSGSVSPCVAALACVMVFAAPYGWQNTLWGFQSGLLLLLLFCAVAAHGIATAKPWSSDWWLGMLALWLTPLASAGGLPVIVGLILALVLTGLARLWLWRTIAPSLAGCGIALAIAMALRIGAPANSSLQAESFSEFLRAFTSSLAWPLVAQPWAALFIWSPLLVWIGLVAAGSRPATGTPAILILGLIAAVHAAGIAFARGRGLTGGMPPSRYQDLLALGPLANLGALLLLVRAAAQGSHQRASRLLLCGWIALATLGLARLTYQNHTVNLVFMARSNATQLANLRRYIETHDPKVFENGELYEISHTNPPRLGEVLDNAAIQPFLPRILQASIPYATRTEHTVHIALKSGGWLFFGGLAGIAACAASLRFSRNPERVDPP